MMHRQSQTGMDFAVGTPGYISPEQVRGMRRWITGSDSYSVGVIPFRAADRETSRSRATIRWTCCSPTPRAGRRAFARRLAASGLGARRGRRSPVLGCQQERGSIGRTAPRELREKYNNAVEQLAAGQCDRGMGRRRRLLRGDRPRPKRHGRPNSETIPS